MYYVFISERIFELTPLIKKKKGYVTKKCSLLHNASFILIFLLGFWCRVLLNFQQTMNKRIVAKNILFQ